MKKRVFNRKRGIEVRDIIKKETEEMVEVMVKVTYKDKYYITNVIAHKDMSEEKIKLIAKEQVKKQWSA